MSFRLSNLWLTEAIVLLVGVLILASCTPAAEQSNPEPTPTAAAEETAVPTPSPAPTVPPPTEEPYPVTEPTTDPLPNLPEDGAGEVDSQLLAQIIADAAQRSGAAPEDIQIVRAESTTWRDGSLGCPQPGMMYTQALVEGYWIVLEADGQTYDYRATQRGTFRLCEK